MKPSILHAVCLTACICGGISYAICDEALPDRSHIDAHTGATGPSDPFVSSSFTIDDIVNWTGSGNNRAAIAFQWSDEGQSELEVYGFKWDGFATGFDMLKSVVKANPRLFCLVQQTVGPTSGSIGNYTLAGAGYHFNTDNPPVLIDPKSLDEICSDDGFFTHPRGLGHDGINVDYDYDEWHTADTDDIWEAGWYTSGHWIYWTADPDWNLHYSGTGMCGRFLKNGSWDLWAFVPSRTAWEEWKPFVAAAEADGIESKLETPIYQHQPEEKWFSLDGYRTDSPERAFSKPGVYIKQTAAGVSKIFIR